MSSPAIGRAILMMGPTGAGKSALVAELAERLPIEIISVDSAQVYRGLAIGSAKPDAATLDRHPHALIDIRDPAQAYSAAEFRADALAAMRRLVEAGCTPLLVGGTGLYFRALEHGLSTLPEADPALRTRLATEAAEHGWPALHARLARLDPVAAARIQPSDPQRIQRALEVIELSGRPLSAQQGGLRERLPYRVLKLALIPADRAPLHARIAMRFDAMLTAGFLDEVRGLRARGDLHPDLPALRAVGYRQAWAHLDGTSDAGGFRSQSIAATRQLAKRQITWLRGELDARVLDPEDAGCGGRAARALDAFLTD